MSVDAVDADPYRSLSDDREPFADDVAEDLRRLGAREFEMKYPFEPPSGREWYVHADDSFGAPTDSPEVIEALVAMVANVSSEDWALVDDIVDRGASSATDIGARLDALRTIELAGPTS